MANVSASTSYQRFPPAVTTIPSSTVKQEASMNNVSTADLQKLILQVRNTVCSSIGDGDVRLWVSLDVSGKLLGIGASTQSGLEVTFHCKTRVNNDSRKN